MFNSSRLTGRSIHCIACGSDFTHAPRDSVDMVPCRTCGVLLVLVSLLEDTRAAPLHRLTESTRATIMNHFAGRPADSLDMVQLVMELEDPSKFSQDDQ
jgi:hypothetical protein